MSWAAGARPDCRRNEISPRVCYHAPSSRSVPVVPEAGLSQVSLCFARYFSEWRKKTIAQSDRRETFSWRTLRERREYYVESRRRSTADTSVALHGRVTFASCDARDLVAMAPAERSVRAIGGGGIGTRAVGGQLRTVQRTRENKLWQWNRRNKATRNYITEVF